MKKQLVYTCIALMTIASVGNAASIIDTVTATSSSSTTAPDIVVGVDGVELYTDEAYTLVDVPDDFNSGRQYLQVVQYANADAGNTDANYQVDITTTELGIIYVGIDERITTQPFDWMEDTNQTNLPAVFFDTGISVGLDEDASGEANNSFRLWATIAPPTVAGESYSFFTQNDGSANNYFIAADDHLVTVPIPEPTCLTLIGLGLVGLAGLRRRR